MATINLETIKLIGNGVLDAKHVAVLMQADLLAEEAELDPIQMSRVCAIMTDAEELLLKGEQFATENLALSQVEELYPQAYQDGTQFRHPGGIYIVDIKRTLRMTDEEGTPLRGPLYTRVRTIDAEKKELAKEQARLTIEKVDKMRENYVQEFTGTSRYDTRNYQLVINMDEINEDAAVELILAYIKSMAA